MFAHKRSVGSVDAGPEFHITYINVYLKNEVRSASGSGQDGLDILQAQLHLLFHTARLHLPGGIYGQLTGDKDQPPMHHSGRVMAFRDG